MKVARKEFDDMEAKRCGTMIEATVEFIRQIAPIIEDFRNKL